MSEAISESFALVAELAAALGVTAIGDLPGCWEHKLDDQWTIALNGHDTPMPASIRHAEMVDPYHLYVTYNGWPAGLLTPYDGTFAAGGGANEDTFCAAVRAAIARAKEAA